LQQVTGRLVTAQSDLQDERQINRALQQNQTAWQSKFQALEKEFNEYKIDKDKVSIMFFYSLCLRFWSWKTQQLLLKAQVRGVAVLGECTSLVCTAGNRKFVLLSAQW